MKIFLKITIYSFLFLFVSVLSFAQNKDFEVFGLLVEDETKQPIPFASVVLHQKNTKKIIAGKTSDENGKFNVKTSNTDFYVAISFMGFQTKTITEFSVIRRKNRFGHNHFKSR
ncbi:carboxypeptidase-like regulatory domain-containing protein [Polaribacter sp. R77954]|uniref:carboxypeptidase-like regulatory domain-containing protein n=1 Tax=Polaribacter sp. R77954 TaxID=3093870 RepID=UPI0037C8F7BD